MNFSLPSLSIPVSFWKAVRGGVRFLLIGLVLTLGMPNGEGSAYSGGDQPPTAPPPLSETVPTEEAILLEEPGILTPTLTTCSASHWMTLTNTLSDTFYLALNVSDAQHSTNQGEWRPALPRDGYYRVEAYIPSHPSIDWCSGGYHASYDTSAARYTIEAAEGFTATVRGDQRPLNDEWLLLGEYRFLAGNGGRVKLNDVTGEASATRSVAFSAMRFTWLAAERSFVYLPVVLESDPPLPTSNVVLRNEQMLDKCTIPSIGQMQTWWEESPYYVFGLYMGGSSFASSCNVANASWISTVRTQGWLFVPTWVGPQAPCTSYKSRMSADPGEAYLQGRAEAESASVQATLMGLTVSGIGGTIIYYDLEAYGGATTACRNTVKSFLAGWTERLHELGNRSAAYGSGCSSYMTDWASITPPFDDIWPASWYTSNYDPNASVFGVSCLSDSVWANHQRLRQYAGTHTETWGGVAFTMDSNITDGEVMDPAIGDPTPGTPPTPAPLPAPSAEKTSFADGQYAWKLNGDIEGGLQHFSVSRSQDGGRTWERLADPLPPALPEWSARQLYFRNRQHGWIVLKRVSSPAFSSGLLLTTRDGGQSWQSAELPIGEAATFANEQEGWLAGGVAGNELYRTSDGGQRWERVQIVAEGDGRRVFYPLPVFESGGDGWIAISVQEPASARVEFHVTLDGGDTWALSATLPLASTAWRDAPLLAAAKGLQGWAVADPLDGQVYGVYRDGKVERLGKLPPGVTSLAFTTPEAGQARAETGVCQGEKGTAAFTCQLIPSLWKTQDGGRSWEEE